MKLKHIIIYFLLISSSNVFAQSVIIKGKIVDRNSKQRLSNVTVKVGMEATITDENGFFILTAQLKTLREKGINFSSVGYFNIHLVYESNHFYEVELIENTTQLKEVAIGTGEDIIKKAIKKIPENYPDKAVVIKGILRTQSWRNQSEYFKSDAIIKAYIPRYNSTEKTTVAVLQNKIDTLYDKSLKYLKHSSNYNVVDFQDIAHNNYILKKIAKKKKLDYFLIGKQVFNNHKVFVVNTILKEAIKNYDKIDATLYIDTATYAIVAANIYTHNLVRPGILTLKMLNYQVTYEKIGKKWYLKETHAVAKSEFNKQAPQTIVDFVRTEIDSINVSKLQYNDIIQGSDNVLLIDKPASKDIWDRNNSLFKKEEDEGKMTIISNNLLDTIKQNNAIANPVGSRSKKSFKLRVFDYLNKNNVRSNFGLTKFPVEVNNQTNISPSVNYGLGIGYNYRLYRNLFAGFQVSTNFWNNKHIDLSTLAFNVSNEFVFNKSSRNIIFTPYTGFERIAVSYKGEKFHSNTFNYGLRVSYELTHKRALFLSFGLNSPLDRYILNDININPTYYATGLGFVFK